MAAPRGARFARAFLVTALLLATSLLVLAFLLDPYDTGHSLLALKPGVRPQGPRMASASRGRDPAFEAAIIGNSHIQLISPDGLTARTGITFLSLATPGTGPKETLALIDWFLRKRPEPARAIVVGIDEHWCTPDPALPNKRPFPFWLVSRDLGDYLLGLMRYDVLQELPFRIAYLRSRDSERARPDGYWDYEANFDAQGPEAARDRRTALETPLQIGGGNHTGPFPAASALESLILAAAPEAALILLRPPSYMTSRPLPGSEDAAADAACRAAFNEITLRRPRTTLIDWRINRPENDDPDQFFDHTHYRRSLAVLVEAEVAAALAQRP